MACNRTSRPSFSTRSARETCAALAITAIATIVAPVLGPTLGGYLIEHLDWRWIFYVNVPFGAIAVFSNYVLVEDPPWEKEKAKQKAKVSITSVSP